MITRETLDAIRQVPVADIIESYGIKVIRTKTGGKCCCPFHADRSPSLSIKAATNTWRCFTCGDKGGSGIDFVQQHEGLDFLAAAGKVAQIGNIEVERGEETDAQKAARQHRETLFAALDQYTAFLREQFDADTDEARACREYAYGRWGKKFCDKIKFGYAPRGKRALMDYIKEHAVNTEALRELGILARGDTGEYAMFRERLMFPIKHRSRLCGYTGRIMTAKENTGKYMNSAASEIFKKNEIVFGLTEAAGAAYNSRYLILVEGAPDVYRLWSVGLNNAVASLGTAWTEEHFRQIKALVDDVCFIPDSDVPGMDEAGNTKAHGAGVEGVMRAGRLAMACGLNVTVRELPYGVDEATGEITKNDADSYITKRDDFSALREDSFVVWLAQKKFAAALSIAEKKAVTADIAALLATMPKGDSNAAIAELTPIYGNRTLWETAVKEQRRKAKTKGDGDGDDDDDDSPEARERKLLHKFGLFIRNNMYYDANAEEPVRLSNFILKPMYHVADGSSSVRLFRVINEYGQEKFIEFTEEELTNLGAFRKRVGREGNYIWKAKDDKLQTVKEYLYALTDTAEPIKAMGWDKYNELYAWGNGVLKDGHFYEVDNMGIARVPGMAFYLPATSDMYRKDLTVYQFERMFQHKVTSGITLRDFTAQVIEVFGDNGKIGICYLLAALFYDLIFPIKNSFPLLNLFGIKGSGKTSLATTLQSVFNIKNDPPNLGVTSVPVMNDRASQVCNGLVVFDEYKATIHENKIDLLKAFFGGTGQAKRSGVGQKGGSQTLTTSAICFCGQDLPTGDIALYSRCIHLTFNRTGHTPEEKRRCEDLKLMANQGNTHLAVEILNKRGTMEKSYRKIFYIVRNELEEALSDINELETRLLDNWVVPLAAYRTLESVLDLPMSYTDLFRVTVNGVRYQNEGCKKNNEMSDFWDVLESMHTNGKLVERAHFRIKAHRHFKAIGAATAKEFLEPRRILYLNAPAISQLYAGRNAQGGNNTSVSKWNTVLTYLKVMPEYLGLKQDRFYTLQANGTFEFEIEQDAPGHGIKRYAVKQPKALCFDYEMLKEKYGLSLDTERMSDYEACAEDYLDEQAMGDGAAATTPPPAATPLPGLDDAPIEESPF